MAIYGSAVRSTIPQEEMVQFTYTPHYMGHSSPSVNLTLTQSQYKEWIQQEMNCIWDQVCNGYGGYQNDASAEQVVNEWLEVIFLEVEL